MQFIYNVISKITQTDEDLARNRLGTTSIHDVLIKDSPSEPKTDWNTGSQNDILSEQDWHVTGDQHLRDDRIFKYFSSLFIINNNVNTETWKAVWKYVCLIIFFSMKSRTAYTKIRAEFLLFHKRHLLAVKDFYLWN